MANTYKNISPLPIGNAEPGAEFEADFTVAEEADLLDSGRMEIVPREYENIGTQEVHGAKPGEKFTAALRKASEAALTEGGHVRRVRASKSTIDTKGKK